MVRLEIVASLVMLLTPPALAAPQEPVAEEAGSPQSFPEVERLLREKNFSAALPAAQSAARANPRSARAHYLLGRTQFYLEHDAEALTALNTSIELDPKFPDAWFFRGLLFAYGKKTELALTDFEKAAQLDPRDSRYWFELGRYSERIGRDAAASSAFERVVKLDPKSAAAWFALGSLSSKGGHHAEAAELWDKALQVDPNYVDAHYNLGLHHQLRGDPNRSLSHYLAVLEQRPDDVEVVKKVVQAYFRLEDYARAGTYRERLLSLVAQAKDPAVRGLTEFCFDQFDAPGGRFFAYERIDKTGDLYYWFTFRFTGPDGKMLRSINLESSSVIREHGVKFILGADEGKVHRNLMVGFREMPPYPELKKLVLESNARLVGGAPVPDPAHP